jgi:uncharacterized protein (TIGR00369 family)
MGILEYFNESPFRKLVGVEITAAEDGYAEGRLPLSEEHSSNDRNLVAQGGVAFTLADSVGGAAAVSLHERPTPTIDFRIDYLAPGTDDLRATAEVVRNGSETSLVEVDVYDAADTLVARGTGVYKTSDLPGDAPWDLDHE